MKFRSGDETDRDLCTALQHEFLRCHDALREFQASAGLLVSQPGDRVLAYSAYNAYARFIHHLYEFVVGALARERRDARFFEKQRGKAADQDAHVSAFVHRVVTSARNTPESEGESKSCPEMLPQDFAEKFRKCRNIAYGHVTPDRPRLNLSEFYEKYHTYLCILYQHAREWWGLRSEEFPDLKEITQFSITARNNSAPPRDGL